jgi:hypothetical protein
LAPFAVRVRGLRDRAFVDGFTGREMADTELKSHQDAAPNAPAPDRLRTPEISSRRRRIRILPLLLTLIAIVAAVGLGRNMWDLYMEAPWTRAGTVLVYVVTMAPRGRRAHRRAAGRRQPVRAQG